MAMTFVSIVHRFSCLCLRINICLIVAAFVPNHPVHHDPARRRQAQRLHLGVHRRARRRGRLRRRHTRRGCRRRAVRPRRRRVYAPEPLYVPPSRSPSPVKKTKTKTDDNRAQTTRSTHTPRRSKACSAGTPTRQSSTSPARSAAPQRRRLSSASSPSARSASARSTRTRVSRQGGCDWYQGCKM